MYSKKVSMFMMMVVAVTMLMMAPVVCEAQEPQVHSDNAIIEEFIQSPWLRTTKGRVVLTLGDAFLRHFRSDDWGIYSDKNGTEMIGLKGEVMTGMGATVGVEYYFSANPQNPTFMYFVMGGQYQPIAMGQALMRDKKKEDIAAFNRGDLK